MMIIMYMLSSLVRTDVCDVLCVYSAVLMCVVFVAIGGGQLWLARVVCIIKGTPVGHRFVDRLGWLRLCVL